MWGLMITEHVRSILFALLKKSTRGPVGFPHTILHTQKNRTRKTWTDYGDARMMRTSEYPA